MAYSVVVAEVLADGSQVFWYTGTDASKPTSGLKVGSIFSTTDTGKVYKATSTTVWTELASGSGTTAGPEGAKYSPDRSPSSGLDANGSDEFLGSINTGLQTWGNQGTATRTWELDTMRIHTAASASIDRKALWFTSPGAVDWVSVIKLSCAVPSGNPAGGWAGNAVAGLYVLESGSIATPTSLSGAAAYFTTGSQMSFGFKTATSYTSAYGTVGSDLTFGVGQLIHIPTTGVPFWLQLHYTASSKALTAWFSLDGRNFRQQPSSTRTLSAHPANHGVIIDQNTANVVFDVIVYYMRTITSGAGLSYPYQIGA